MAWHRSGRLLVVALAAVLAVGAGACGSSSSPSADRDPDVVQAAPRPPLRVVLAGDSVAHNLAAPLRAALEGSGEMRYVGTLTIPRNGERFLWASTLYQYDPDVVVVLMGTWEIDKAIRETDFPRSYLDGVVEPYIRQINESGADLIWVAMPTTTSPRSTIMRNLDDVYAQAVAGHARDVYVDSDEVLLDDQGHWTQTLPGPDGTPESLRGDDGAHLCPAGAVRVVQQVVDVLSQRWDLAPASDWQTGPWRTRPRSPFPAICAEG